MIAMDTVARHNLIELLSASEAGSRVLFLVALKGDVDILSFIDKDGYAYMINLGDAPTIDSSMLQTITRALQDLFLDEVKSKSVSRNYRFPFPIVFKNLQ